ncbi:transporter substrate-binding domain-containing protein [Paraoerskovia marina]|uniref:transporter substrate-binding domain-containing protein n=1 Tax=Paraoerskovia marina TaxID=545619 RepID=UPI0004928FEB|nr:transporter substrate-binding domain-containing protein [Paraoerskovia marina]
MQQTTIRTSARRRTLGAVIAVAAIGLTGACASDDDSAEGSTTADGIELVEAGTLTACTHLPYKPFEYTENGEVVGFDADLAQLVADDLGVELDVVSTGWEQITGGAAFAAGQCDLGMGAATITPEREESVAFSDPYFNATQALLVAADSGYESLEDLDGKQLGVQTGTTGEIYANDNAEEYGYETVVFEDSLSQANAVKTGKVDAAINDNGTVLFFASENTDTTVTEEFDTGESYGFMAAKDSENADALLERFNEVLAAAQDDGTYDEIFATYFGAVPGELNS